MKAIGFTADELTGQYIVRVLIVVLLSVSAGLLLSNTLGELLAGALLRSFGSALLIKSKIKGITTAQSIRG
jgi:putative ABC transport system permease protein